MLNEYRKCAIPEDVWNDQNVLFEIRASIFDTLDLLSKIIAEDRLAFHTDTAIKTRDALDAIIDDIIVPHENMTNSLLIGENND